MREVFDEVFDEAMWCLACFQMKTGLIMDLAWSFCSHAPLCFGAGAVRAFAAFVFGCMSRRTWELPKG